MTETSPGALGAPGFTILGGDDALMCTDDACLVPSAPVAATDPAAK